MSGRCAARLHGHAAEEAARKNALGMAGQTIERRLRGEEEAEASDSRQSVRSEKKKEKKRKKRSKHSKARKKKESRRRRLSSPSYSDYEPENPFLRNKRR